MQTRRSSLRWLVLVSLALVAPAARAEDPMPARFHHVRLNVTNPKRSVQFYRRVFGAVPVQFNDAVEALFTERSFILFNQVAEPPEAALNTGIWHIGWGGVDVKNEYEWWKNHDVDIHTPLSPLPGPNNYYMYISGPDKELIEINTMGHHRFAHVHFFADDVNAACAWYAKHLGLKPRAPQVPKPPAPTEPRKPGDPKALSDIWINTIQCDNVLMIFFGKPDWDPAPYWWPDPPLKEIQPTRGRPIDHLAFSYRQIEPVFERMQREGATIVEPIAVREPHKLKSFFVQGPDQVLIEVVESKPIPEGLWQD
ncbi:MAG: VOC family protein [Pirellulales bacterium]|nr:VOC family protein [Pirellulales bacterium]